MKRVYTCFCTDVIHEGHRNIIREAGKYGELTIGVLSDAAMIRFNRFPTISFEERMQLVKDIPEVSNVVVQDDVRVKNKDFGLPAAPSAVRRGRSAHL